MESNRRTGGTSHSKRRRYWLSLNSALLERLRKMYPVGARVELIHMDDPYNTELQPGSNGTVVLVDDIGTIHVHWDCGSSLGVVYGEDSCRIVEN